MDTKGIGKGDITSNNINYRHFYNTFTPPIIYTLADHLPSAPPTCYLLPLCLEADIQYMESSFLVLFPSQVTPILDQLLSQRERETRLRL